MTETEAIKENPKCDENNLLNYGWIKSLFFQIENLRNPAELESLVTCLRLIVHVKPDKKPDLALTNSGQLIAAWVDGKDRLTIECLPDDQVRWTKARWTAKNEIEHSSELVPLKQLLPALVMLDRQGSMRRFFRHRRE